MAPMRMHQRQILRTTQLLPPISNSSSIKVLLDSAMLRKPDFKPAGKLFEAAEGASEEAEGAAEEGNEAGRPLRCGGWRYGLHQHRKALEFSSTRCREKQRKESSRLQTPLWPLHRGSSGSTSNISESIDQSYKAKDLSEDGFRQSRQWLTIVLLRLGLVLITVLALLGSVHWTISVSTSSRVSIYRGYRRLQQLIINLSDIGEISLNIPKLEELEFCPPEYEDYVPCYYNVSKASDSIDPDAPVEYERYCVRGSISCLILPLKNYKIPLRWPSGRNFIRKENVRITGNEFSSGSLTKRMMVEEEQISFARTLLWWMESKTILII